MGATENQQALLNAVGLKYKDLGYGKGAIVKNDVGEQIPSGTEISDIYYPALFQHVVSQQITEGIRTFALQNIFVKEEWINGVKEYISNGLIELKDYDKVITIDDFNPADPSQSVIKFSVDILKYGALKYTKNEYLQPFTTPAHAEEFVNQLVRRISDSWQYFLQGEKAKILAGDTTASLEIIWDEVIDTSELSTLDFVELIYHYAISLGTASSSWLALTDETFIYSATENDLTILLRPFMKAAIARESSNLYNYSQIIGNKLRNAETIDLLRADSSLAGTGIKAWLFDSQALRMGVQVDNIEWMYRIPKAQNILEYHNWVGFSYIPTLYKSVWTDTPEVEVARMKKMKGFNKDFKIKVTKGIDVIKNIITQNKPQAK